MQECRDCKHEVSEDAVTCPHCGAPKPAVTNWDGWGYEYKSRLALFGLPLLHISFKYGANRRPVPAVGVIAVGQFGMGIINISQFGIGLVSISQFTIALVAVAQFAIAYSCITQIGIFVHEGFGQILVRLGDLF